MIPLSVRPNSKSYTLASDKLYLHFNIAIICICVVVYLFQMYSADSALAVIESFGIKAGTVNFFPSAFTYMFFHGSLIHLFSNLWILYVLGTPLEKRIGSLSYLFLFLCGGALSGIVVSALKLSQNGVYIGASAGISAVIGAFLVVFPKARLFVLFPLIVIPYFFEISSWLFVICWFGGQLFFAILNSMGPTLVVSSTEYWSHVFGLLVGLTFFSKYLFHSNPLKTQNISPV